MIIQVIQMQVRPKKFLGQHFLLDSSVSERMASAISEDHVDAIVEIGPGTGALTQFLIKKVVKLLSIEKDRESVAYLRNRHSDLDFELIEADFLRWHAPDLPGKICITGNLPYNISSQILFKILDLRTNWQVEEMVFMLQKEVAMRIASPPGNKTYGILSVLLQLWYEVEVLFTVAPVAFNPPPKVDSAVIRFKRNKRQTISIDGLFLKKVVKTAFGNRRKTLRNALKSFDLSQVNEAYLSARAEELSVDNFLELAAELSHK